MTSVPLSTDVCKSPEHSAGYLLVMSASNSPAHVTIPQQPQILLLGRDSSCDVRFDLQRSSMVSRRHAEIAVRTDGVYLRDLNSANGTWLNGRPLDGIACLRDEDVVCLGGPSGPSIVVHLSSATGPVGTVNTRWEAPSQINDGRAPPPGGATFSSQQGRAPRQEVEPYSSSGAASSAMLTASPPTAAPSPPLADAQQLQAPPLGCVSRPQTTMTLQAPPSAFTPFVQKRGTNALSARSESWLGVDAPLTMALGTTALVRAVAIRDALQEALVQGALRQETSQILAALLGPVVRMNLVPRSVDDFQVRRLTPAKQRVRRDKLAVWEWLITANELGPDKLGLAPL